MDYANASCPKSLILKVDVRKAFDTVFWDFVSKVLEAQGFLPLLRTWIQQCITSPSFSIAVNVELASFFQKKKRLRQGDSISPYGDENCLDFLKKHWKKIKSGCI